MTADSGTDDHEITHHRLPWTEFDALARGGGGARVVRRLRRVERSRRLLLLRAVVEETTKTSQSFGPLPSPDSAWELLERVQRKAPAALDLILAHPYTGSWASYVTRLLRDQITGIGPLWAHVGHVHALAAAAAIHAELDFETAIPLWHGTAALPTLGMAVLPTDTPWSVADVRARRGTPVEIGHGHHRVALPDGPGWLGMRRISVRAGRRTLAVRLDDVDPYRGLYEPVSPRRLPDAEVDEWDRLLAGAWQLLTEHLPDVADALTAGLDSVVPRQAVGPRANSASTEEAFGSAVIARPSDATSLAAALVHEFQHIRLGGLLQLVRLYDDDPRERCYVPWRDDPRPIAGVLQGIYAFFGVTMLWRELMRTGTPRARRKAAFEFAGWRGRTWRTLDALRVDPALTAAGRRFLAGVAERLGPWQHEPVPGDIAAAVASIAADHRAGWRIRHVRPDTDTVAALAEAWTAGRPRPAVRLGTGHPPTPIPDGHWSRARADLIALAVEAGPLGGRDLPAWSTVSDATPADRAFAEGRFVDAVRAYRAELTVDADRPTSWVGLGLALSGLGTGPAARMLLECPELVRAVDRRIRAGVAGVPGPDELAAWIGRSG
jgi:HEXXH motif-containing protein